MQLNNLKQSTPALRILLYIASFLVLSVGLSLFFLSEKTEIYFSWPINPPLTAAFLGAGYLASFVLEFFSARQTIWAKARVAVPGVWIFTTLTLILTLIHLERFSFNSPFPITAAGTWVWLIVYISVPIALGLTWFFQIRLPGADPPSTLPLPFWMRHSLLVQGSMMLLAGLVLFFMPRLAPNFWPWQLSVLTSQAVGAWGIGVGFMTVQASFENDWSRLPAFLGGYTFFGLLQLINLVRYPSELDWASASAFIYAIFVASIFLIGAFGLRQAWQSYIHGIW